jgi:hypothetical protein
MPRRIPREVSSECHAWADAEVRSIVLPSEVYWCGPCSREQQEYQPVAWMRSCASPRQEPSGTGRKPVAIRPASRWRVSRESTAAELDLLRPPSEVRCRGPRPRQPQERGGASPTCPAEAWCARGAPVPCDRAESRPPGPSSGTGGRPTRRRRAGATAAPGALPSARRAARPGCGVDCDPCRGASAQAPGAAPHSASSGRPSLVRSPGRPGGSATPRFSPHRHRRLRVGGALGQRLREDVSSSDCCP